MEWSCYSCRKDHCSKHGIQASLRSFDNNSEYLEAAICEMAKHMRITYIKIHGYHEVATTNSKGESTSKYLDDFRFQMNMRSWFWPNRTSMPSPMQICTVEHGEKTQRGPIRKHRAPRFQKGAASATATPTLKEWCHRYCASSTDNKV
jgi:hypothetical protein